MIRRDPDFGALVISLDFELYWGVPDLYEPPSAYDAHVLGARSLVPQLLRMFEEFDIAATWAVVGLLFARDDAEAKRFYPSKLPSYRDRKLSPYRRPSSGKDDERRFYYAPELVEQIADSPHQEIGTHTFGHYFCLEPGQDSEEFEADLIAACNIAQEYGVKLRSIVFPRDQVNQNYLEILARQGIWAYRGNQAGWMHRTGPRHEQARPVRRLARLVDTYLPFSGDNTVDWCDVPQPNGLTNVRASRYLRPQARRLRKLQGRQLSRIVRSMESAAKSKRLFHLWWHPEDMGPYPDENLAFLRLILESFQRCREEFGMRSLSMSDVANEGQPGVRIHDAIAIARDSELLRQTF